MFGDDSFGGIEDLFNQLSGERRRQFGGARSQSQSLLNTVESRGKTILIFDLSGKEVVSAKIKDDIETNEYGERVYGEQKVLEIKFENNEVIKYGLPRALAKGKLGYTFTNGILEVSLKK
jgi:hypothetical protein